MNIPQLQAKRDEILQRLGVASATFGDRSVQYSEASKALAVIDAEIARVESVTSTRPRSTLATFPSDN